MCGVTDWVTCLGSTMIRPDDAEHLLLGDGLVELLEDVNLRKGFGALSILADLVLAGLDDDARMSGP